jgi:hypothetical protein
MTLTNRWMAVGLASVAVGGCVGAHEASARATMDLACAPDELRSAWWSEGGPVYVGDIVVSPSGTHLLLDDQFRSASVRLSDGARSDGSRPTVELSDVTGVRFASPRMTVDAEGRHDYAGATDVFAVGTATPLVGVPWIVARDGGGYSQVVANVSQTIDRAIIVERSIRFGEPDGGVWLRAVRFSGTEEARIDLRTATPDRSVSFESPFSIVVDEARDVVFVATGEQVEAAPAITRVDLASEAVTTVHLEVGESAPFIGLAHVGDPGTQLLDVALTSDGARLLVTTRDGRLRMLDAETLAVSDEASVGVVVANQDTYLPSLRSPVATSAEDGLLAMLDEAGRVVIVDAATMSPVATLDSAAPRTTPDPEHLDDGEARAMVLRFLDDGLIVVTDRGIERFRCPG